MNYTEALEFFVENGISLNEEQLENLKEASAYTRHMRNVSKKYKDIKNAREDLRDLSNNPKVKELDDKLWRKQENMRKNTFNNNVTTNPENYDEVVRRASDHGEHYKDKLRNDLNFAKGEFNHKVNSAHPENTKGKNDHKRAGDFLKIQKAKKVLED